MPRAHLAIAISSIWLGAAVPMAWAFAVLPAWQASALVALAVTAAAAASWMAGAWADRRAAACLSPQAQAAGIALDHRAAGADRALMAGMAERLERANATESAFAEMGLPALVSDEAGNILAVSRGLREMEPRAVPGATIDALYGEGFLATGGGAAEQSLVALRGRRYEAHKRRAGAGRFVITLSPAGCLVTDDDLDAFSTAIAEGRTAFRFSDAAAAHNPALEALNEGLSALDTASVAVRRIAGGQVRGSEARVVPGALGRALSLLEAEMVRLRGGATAEAGRAAELTARLEEAVDACRTSVAALAEIARKTRKSATARPRKRAGSLARPAEAHSGAPIDAVGDLVAAFEARLQDLGVLACLTDAEMATAADDPGGDGPHAVDEVADGPPGPGAVRRPLRKTEDAPATAGPTNGLH